MPWPSRPRCRRWRRSTLACSPAAGAASAAAAAAVAVLTARGQAGSGRGYHSVPLGSYLSRCNCPLADKIVSPSQHYPRATCESRCRRLRCTEPCTAPAANRPASPATTSLARFAALCNACAHSAEPRLRGRRARLGMRRRRRRRRRPARRSSSRSRTSVGTEARQAASGAGAGPRPGAAPPHPPTHLQGIQAALLLCQAAAQALHLGHALLQGGVGRGGWWRQSGARRGGAGRGRGGRDDRLTRFL